MSSDLLLSAKGINKTYSSCTHPIATLRHALFGGKLSKRDEYPVLKNIDLDICHGETVGILGRNGAGKTTLLGILGNVIQPTSGRVERYGRIATLLGLTAGFNVNFTGRENAYLFCSIQGLTQNETNQRIDAISGFADIGRYFDLPIRTYSSGMQARLAFSCAVHVDAELIIIDETLAVGDANFRMKCYDRIGKMKREGQTFLLVSHNQNMVANFCTRGIVLEGGAKIFDGDTIKGVEEYKRIRTESMGDSELEGKLLKSNDTKSKLPKDVVIREIDLKEQKEAGTEVGVITATLLARQNVGPVSVNFGIRNQHGIVVCALDGVQAGFVISGLKKGERKIIEMQFKKYLLPGKYFISTTVHELIGDVKKPQDMRQNVMSFEVFSDSAMSGIADLAMGVKLAGASSE